MTVNLPQDDNHPFVQAMYDFLTECGHRANRPAFVDYVFPSGYNKWQADIKLMTDLAQSSGSHRIAGFYYLG